MHGVEKSMSTPQDMGGLLERGSVSGYTAGTFDMFHIGHLKLLERARDHCDRLIVGVSTDELVAHIKGKWPVVPFEERVEIVRAIRFVDDVFTQNVIDKRVAWEQHRFDRLFVGDDHAGEAMWDRFERDFASLGVEVVYFPYTRHTSSTLLRERLLDLPVTA